MKTIVFQGREIDVPDNVSEDQVARLYSGNGDGGTASSSMFPDVKPSDSWFGDIDPKSLKDNPDWLKASEILYKGTTGKDFAGTKDQLAEYGLNQMGQFNYNLAATGYDAARIRNAPPEMQKAFLYLMETYDNLEISWGGTGRLLYGAVTDPFNYTGLISLGYGTAASQATRVATREGVKSLLKAGAKASVAGAVQSGVSDAARQSVEISAGKSEEFDTGRLALNTGLGAAIGFGLGSTVDAAATAFRKVPEKVVGTVGKVGTEVADAVTPPAGTVVPPVEPTQLGLDLTQPMPTQQLSLGLDSPTVSNKPVDSILDWRKKFTPVENPTPLQAVDNEFGQKLHKAATDPKVSVEEFSKLHDEWQNARIEVERAAARRAEGQGSLPLGEPVAKGQPFAFDGQGRLFDLPEQRAPVKPQTVEELKALQKAEKPPEAPVTKADPEVAGNKAASPESPQGRLQAAVDFVENLQAKTDGNAAQKIIDLIKTAIAPDGWRIMPGGRREISESVKEAVEALTKLNVNAEDAVQVLNRVALEGDRRIGLLAAVQEGASTLFNIRRDLLTAADAAKTASEKAYYNELAAKIGPAQDALGKLDIRTSSGSGQALGIRAKAGAITGATRDVFSPEEIIRRNPGMTLDQANAEFLKQTEALRTEVLNNQRVKELGAKIATSLENGDHQSAFAAIAERRLLVDELTADAAGMEKSVFRRASEKITEYVVGTVFSPSSTVVNIIPAVAKILYKPTLNYLTDGKASIGAIGAAYSAMLSQSKAALNAFKAVNRLEINPTFGKSNDFLSGLPAIEGAWGRLVRFFPRVLEASDAMFGRLHYVSAVAFNTHVEMTEKLIAQGMKPGTKEFKEAVNNAISKTLEGAFTKDTDVVQVLDTLYQIGTARGYTGKKLEEFMKLEMNRNQEIFQKATNVVGRDYTIDTLYKREFSGDNTASKFMKWYENMISAHPLARIGLQMFVRTPARVFEEGMRLTPGLNLVTPKFLEDLKGLNGASRQVRAHGEAMLSMAFGGAIMGMYANGMITGGGPMNYKQRRNKENDREWQPYTIYLPGGTTISFRNLDPFATPLKIIVNAMDRLQMYQFRKAQGSFEKDPTGEVAAVAGVALGSIFQAVKDANLTEGLNQLSMVTEALLDPEKNENKIANFFNEKAKLLVPNVIGKTRQLVSGEPTPLSDAANIMQSMKRRFDPFDETVPTQRDALGNKRYMAYNPAAYFGIGVNTAMEKNISKEDQKVLRFLSDLETVSNKSFVLPYKVADLGDDDLRTKYLPDGKTTWYDRLYDIYRDLGVGAALYQRVVLNKDKLTYGVADANKQGTMIDETEKVIQAYRQLAISMFKREQEEAYLNAYKRQKDKYDAKMGVFDIQTIPR